MKMFGYLAAFMAGSMFGVMTMGLMIANSRDERQEEAMKDAGGYRKQNSKPCDQHDETDSADSDLSGADVSEAPEGDGSSENG